MNNIKPWHIGAGCAIILIAFLLFRKMRFPVKKYTLTSKFGTRTHPISGATLLHNGVDLAAPLGTPVYAPAFGRVEAINYTSAGGNQLFIKHWTGGYRTGYAHLNSISVKANEFVYPGKQIATVGSTGQSTGAHLHLTLRKNGNLVDPLKYFKA